MQCDLSNRELATVLAALRWWQNSTTEDQRGYDIIATDNGVDPLDESEIEELCERLNCE